MSESRHLVLAHRRGLAKDQLVSAVWDFAEALEEGLRGIDRNLPCDSCGEIDVLARDRNGRLAIVDVEATPSETLLLRALAHFDWAVHNALQLRRMYTGVADDSGFPPRLFLVAPQFSPFVRRAGRQLTHPRTIWIRYDVVHVLGRTAILFERVENDRELPASNCGAPV